jgi:hypothetical protein
MPTERNVLRFSISGVTSRNAAPTTIADMLLFIAIPLYLRLLRQILMNPESSGNRNLELWHI